MSHIGIGSGSYGFEFHNSHVEFLVLIGSHLELGSGRDCYEPSRKAGSTQHASLRVLLKVSSQQPGVAVRGTDYNTAIILQVSMVCGLLVASN